MGQRLNWAVNSQSQMNFVELSTGCSVSSAVLYLNTPMELSHRVPVTWAPR